MKQSDFLQSVGRKAYDAHKLSKEESLTKESFRKDLEKVARDALREKYPTLDAGKVKLKCYGSLANGFALAGCDMDLLLSLPDYHEPTKTSTPGDEVEVQSNLEADNEDEERVFHTEVRRVLEKAFLEKEYGARLLTNTRVPILRICQYPSAELLHNLRGYRAAWEESLLAKPVAAADPQVSDARPADAEGVEEALGDLALQEAAPLPSISRGNSGLEFIGDCGIQCDVNFTNFVALHNSALLRLYQSFDPRVGEVGIFVKIWAKARDINTPYRGTLSSYGYVLMVLHYLMNVASPPVIPNLQYLAKIDDGWNPGKKIPLFEGFDVRFVQDPKEIEELRKDTATKKNRESAAQLLRGFFQYYAIREGFHWTRDVVSIRQKGGILRKQEKGWTEAKWAQTREKTVRLRYLLAIEDPFEVDHNVGRTVGHNGLVAIRDEFRRAWSIIESIGAGAEISVDEFLQPVTDRGDSLRKDKEFHQQKQLQMKQELEAKEKLLLQNQDTEGPQSHTNGTSGTYDHGNLQPRVSPESHYRSSNPKLTSTYPRQDRNTSQPAKKWRHRRIELESDDEGDDVAVSPENGPSDDLAKKQSHSESVRSDSSEPKVGRNRSDFLCSREDVLLANGFDHWGEPVAWDIDTQEGRWLQWRDTKIRRGTFHKFLNPTLRELDEQCPYDARRPSPWANNEYKDHLEKLAALTPPWPANKGDPGTSNPLPVGSNHRGEMADSQASKARNDASARMDSGQGPPPNTPSRPGEGSVGKLIPWDRATAGGRWLQYRDNRIRQGIWEHHQRSRFTGLSNDFPYNPRMTWAELEANNQVLRIHYSDTTYRRDGPDDATAPPKILIDDKGPSPAAQLSMSSGPDSTSSRNPLDDLTEHPDREQPSSLMTSQFGQAGQALAPKVDQRHAEKHLSIPQLTPPEASGSLDPEYVRSQRLAFFSSRFTPPKSDIETNDQFYPQTGREHTAETPEKDVDIRSPAKLATSEEDAQSSGSAEEGSSKTQPLQAPQLAQLAQPPTVATFPLQVPYTLCPDLDNSQRPRDEDPMIMPIPRSLGFQFDARQLQDLAIIAQGGNGCAREGAEFNIEEEYELGGGGMMGWKTSTGPAYAEISHGEMQYEAGRGDEDGLLDELPRNMDELSMDE